MKKSLSLKLGLTLIILTVLGGGLTAYLVYENSTHALQKSISDNQTYKAKQTMDEIDRFLQERLVDMQSIADSQQVQSYLLPSSQHSPAEHTSVVEELNDFKNTSGTWSQLALVNGAAGLVATTGQQSLTDTLSAYPAVLKLYAAAAAGKAGYSDALSSPDDPAPIMLFMAPVRDTEAPGEPIVGVLAGKLAWQPTFDILKGIKGTTATLINNKGISLGENQPGAESEVLTKNFSGSQVFKTVRKSGSGAGIFTGLDQPNQKFLTSFVKEPGYKQYHGNGWFLVLETPRSVAFAPAQQLAKTLIIIFAGVLVISVIGGLAVIRTLILKPINGLKEVTGRLARGDFSLRTTIKSNDELGRLGHDFNDMADNMQLANNSLREGAEAARNEQIILQTILDSLPVGVLVAKSPGGQPILVNKAAQHLSGRPTYSDIGSAGYTEAYDIIREDGSAYPTEELPLSITLKTGKPTRSDDVLFRHPDGTTKAIRSFCAPIVDSDGLVRRVVAVIEDISVERNLERSREEFFSIASHELRTPLTAIRGNSDMIQQYYGDKLDDPNLKEMLADIHESANRLIEIVNDFLDTSRLEQKRLKFELGPVDLSAIAGAVVKEYQVTGSRQKIHLEITPPDKPLPAVLADSNRTKQVLINIVGNALKFTEHGSITISFAPGAESIKVLVTDTGRGMTLEAQKLLFKKFEQTGSTVLTRDSVRGTGLGLYISKMLVEGMGGHIAMEHSQEGKGTTFSFSLPILKNTTQKPGSTM